MLRSVKVMLCTLCLVASAASANTIVVHQDGTGDYSTITDAVAAAVPGDVIQVGIGTYSEYVTITKSLSLESEAGAAVTILDGVDAQRIFVVDGSVSVSIRGFTFKRALAEEAAALFVWHQGDAVVEDCIFTDNYATGSNAVAVRHTGSNLHLRNCQFLQNQAGLHSAALSSSMGSNLIVEDCQFIENQALGHGAMNTIGGNVQMTGCLFLRNSGSVGAVTLDGSSGFVSENTFHGNSGPTGTVNLGAGVQFSHNIISGEQHGPGLNASLGSQHTCNLYFDNADGACDEPLGIGEVEGDPLYCEASADVFLVCSGSPALAAENGCGAMGAFGMGCECGPVSIETTTWGELKSSFR